MAGYIYCMKNNHRKYGGCVKVGYTERTPELRKAELCDKWHCAFEVVWDIDVYEPAKAEHFIHTVLRRFRVDYEFFRIDADTVRQLAEKFFDEHWRETEGKELLPTSLVDLAEQDSRGFLLDPPPEVIDPELGLDVNHGPDSDTE
jgi:hypothetical protein